VMAHECTTDLPERQRRARFSSSERRALEAHFTICASCRTARQFTADFDELSTVDPADGARIERLAALARARVTRVPSVRPVRRKVTLVRVMAVAAALLLLVGSAFAGAGLWHNKREAARSTSASANAVNAKTVEPVSPSPMAVASVASSASSMSSASATPLADSLPSLSTVASSLPAADSTSPALLLRQAGDAQRRGERDPAAALYQKLQAQYPASAEALLSHVSLGRVFAERGQPRAAVRQFDAYLSGSRGGVLIPEALYGRARALSGLGDRAEESRTWQRLVRDFPDSAYAEPARRRLAELE
jgi:TolA-binding protein